MKGRQGHLGCIATFGCLLMVVGVGAPRAAPATAPLRHTVLRGQTLTSIARSYGVPVSGLAAANGIGDPASLRAGARLVIPRVARAGGRHIVERRPGPRRPAAHVAAPSIAPEVRDLPPPVSPAMSPALPDPTTLRARLPWPIIGPILSGFDRPRGGHRHQGIDISSEPGTPIHAVADGVVTLAEEHYGNYGRLIAIEHDDGMVSYYGHNMKNLVRPGQRVVADEVIALVGHSGNASCDHLHFEIRIGGEAIDPMTALTPQP